jgi:hypothetical protein
MAIIHDGVEYDSVMLGISGRIELSEDDQAEAIVGRSVQVVLRGRVVRLAFEPGGLHTERRAVATVKLDALDELRECDALPGQLRLADAAT